MTGWPRLLRYGLLFAALATVFAFYSLALETYQVALEPRAPGNFQERLGQVGPLPRAMWWRPGTVHLLTSIAVMGSATLLSLLLLLLAIAAYALLRLLNPTFRVTTGVDWDRALLIRTYMHTAPLIKAFLILVAAVIPLAALWAGLAYLTGSSYPAVALRCAAIGAAVWALFDLHGVAGDYDSGNYQLPRDPAVLRDLFARGAAAGLALACAGFLWRYTEPGPLIAFYASLAGFGEQSWRLAAALSLGTAAAIGFAAGGILTVLAPPGVSAVRRIRLSAGPAALLGFTWIFWAGWIPRQMAMRYDYPADPRDAAQTLRRKAGLATPPATSDTVLLFRRRGIAALSVPRESLNGVPTGDEARRRIERFLRSRAFATALSEAAFLALHDSATAAWDTLETLRVQYENLTRCPDPRYITLMLQKLQASPSTPEVIRYADRLADESRFVYLTRDARMTMADHFARLGERAKAETWYRKADVPASRIPELLSARTMFDRGVVEGSLTLNGRPLAGATVGLAPMVAIPELFRTSIAPGVVRPFWFRWVGPVAATDPQGKFRFERVVAGEYRLLIRAPSIRLTPFDRRLSASANPGTIFVGFGRPRAKLEPIDLRIAL